MASNVIDVYVKLTSGKTLQFDLSASDTMGSVYKRVAAEQGVSEDRVTLKYTGKVLKKAPTLGSLGVCAETILKAEIVQEQTWSVIVQLPSGETVPLTVQNTASVKALHDLIETSTGASSRKHVLKLGDTELTNKSLCLAAAGIKNESLVTVIEKEEVITKKPGKKSATKKSKSGSTRRGSIESTGSESSLDTETDITRGGNTEVNTDTPTLDEQDKENILSTFDAAPGKMVDVVFSFDTTGSMYSCLQQVRNKLQDTVSRLTQQIPNIRIGVMAHGDYCDYDKYVERHVDLTADTQTLVDFVNNVPSTGGGDAPECYEWALHKAVHLDWAEDSAKALVVIGDCLPHEQSYTDQHVNWHDQLDLLKGMGVKVYGVKALNSRDSEAFYRELSDHTGGAYITFQNFSIITEMFLAVCYREASDEQFEAFCEEVEQQDVATSDEPERSNTKVKDIKKVLSQLKEQKGKEAEETPKRYVAAAWWDPTLDHGRPQYSYDADTDKWRPAGRSITATRPTTAGVTRSATFHAPATGSSRKDRIRRSFSFGRKSRSNHSAPTDTPARNSSKTKKACVIM